jgi:glucose/arabinose dehydrogenase
MPTTEGDLVVEARKGYSVVPFARGLDMPSAVCFDTAGNVCVLEAGGFMGLGSGRTPPRIKIYSPAGTLSKTIPLEDAVFPAFGITWGDGCFFITHRDAKHLGCVSRVELDGRVTAIVTGLPSRGDHGTNQICLGPDGKLYFAQGSATNSGVVGVDDFVAFGWPRVYPEVHDVPAKNLVLTGKNFLTVDPRGAQPGMKTVTGAFRPFGQSGEPGGEAFGNTKCNSAILCCDTKGGNLEVHSWGFRNPFGLAFSPEHQLHASCQGMDVRGSRPVANDVDTLIAARKGAWYGWPDFTTDLKPLLDDRNHDPPSSVGRRAEPLVDLKSTDVATPDPKDVAASFPPGTQVAGFAWAPPAFGEIGQQLVIAELGPSDGRDAGRVVTVNARGDQETVLANAGGSPASRSGALGRGLERPIDAKFGPDGALYVVDFGVLTARIDDETGVAVIMREGTGFVWKVTPGEHSGELSARAH